VGGPPRLPLDLEVHNNGLASDACACHGLDGLVAIRFVATAASPLRVTSECSTGMNVSSGRPQGHKPTRQHAAQPRRLGCWERPTDLWTLEYRGARNFSVSTVTPAMPRMRVSPSLFPLPFLLLLKAITPFFSRSKLANPSQRYWHLRFWLFSLSVPNSSDLFFLLYTSQIVPIPFLIGSPCNALQMHVYMS